MDGLRGCLVVLILATFTFGCKSSQPNLKPEIPKYENLNTPPQEGRFNSPQYPKQALADDNSRKTMFDQEKSSVVPTRGSQGPGRNGLR